MEQVRGQVNRGREAVMGRAMGRQVRQVNGVQVRRLAGQWETLICQVHSILQSLDPELNLLFLRGPGSPAL